MIYHFWRAQMSCPENHRITSLIMSSVWLYRKHVTGQSCAVVSVCFISGKWSPHKDKPNYVFIRGLDRRKKHRGTGHFLTGTGRSYVPHIANSTVIDLFHALVTICCIVLSKMIDIGGVVFLSFLNIYGHAIYGYKVFLKPNSTMYSVSINIKNWIFYCRCSFNVLYCVVNA